MENLIEHNPDLTTDESKKPKTAIQIDLENMDLSYQQVKALRVQVERDCELLRNRVRMLFYEKQKAKKKIEETRAKTKNILQLKENNDKKFVERLFDKEKTSI